MLQSAMTVLSSPLALVALMAAGGMTMIIYSVVGQRSGVPDPLAKLREQSRAMPSRERSLKRGTESDSALLKKLDRYRSILEPADAKELEEARRQMIQAGYHSRTAVRDFHAAKLILALGGLMLGLFYLILLPPADDASILSRVLPIAIPTFAGYYLPIYWVGKRRTERQTEIQRGFPDALDMLLICSEAGQSMDQSISRVAQELRAGYPALAEELETVAHETKAGKDRMTVLRELGERCGNPDIKSFATVLIQSATYGTSVADALRVYAAEMRDKRVMLAEEKANVLPTKLTLGTMMFTVPPLLIILIGPSLYGVAKMLSEADFSI